MRPAALAGNKVDIVQAIAHDLPGKFSIEGRQLAAFEPGKTVQINVGQMHGIKHARTVEDRFIENADLIGPELVSRMADLQLSEHSCNLMRQAAEIFVTRVPDDA